MKNKCYNIITNNNYKYKNKYKILHNKSYKNKKLKKCKNFKNKFANYLIKVYNINIKKHISL